MSSLGRAATCIVCLISAYLFTYPYVRVLRLTVCVRQLDHAYSFAATRSAQPFQCVNSTISSSSRSPHQPVLSVFKQTHTSHVDNRAKAQTALPIRAYPFRSFSRLHPSRDSYHSHYHNDYIRTRVVRPFEFLDYGRSRHNTSISDTSVIPISGIPIQFLGSEPHD
jgi:hypothetical protein